MDKLHWDNSKLKLSELKAWELNPRQIKAKGAELLIESIQEFGQIHPLVVGPKEEDALYPVYDGHQRKQVWSLNEQYGQDYEVDVRIASRPLTVEERRKLTILLHRGTNGEWDWDMLANTFEIPDLLSWGFEERELHITGEFNTEFTRPTFETVIESFVKPEGDRGKSEKNENWFYIEFYESDEEYNLLHSMLEPFLLSQHQVKPEFFYNLIKEAYENGNLAVPED